MIGLFRGQIHKLPALRFSEALTNMPRDLRRELRFDRLA
jgi:hypothetical protein